MTEEKSVRVHSQLQGVLSRPRNIHNKNYFLNNNVRIFYEINKLTFSNVIIRYFVHSAPIFIIKNDILRRALSCMFSQLGVHRQIRTCNLNMCVFVYTCELKIILFLCDMHISNLIKVTACSSINAVAPRNAVVIRLFVDIVSHRVVNGSEHAALRDVLEANALAERS